MTAACDMELRKNKANSKPIKPNIIILFNPKRGSEEASGQMSHFAVGMILILYFNRRVLDAVVVVSNLLFGRSR